MKFDILDYGRGELLKILPEHLHETVQTGGLMTYGALDGSRVVGLCLFSDTYGEPGQVDLKYIFVTESDRRKKIGTNMIKNACELFKRERVRTINTAACGSPDSLMGVYRFLVKNRFVPLVSDAHIIKYYVNDLDDTKFARLLMGKQGVLPGAVQFDSYDDPRLVIFLRTIGREMGFRLSRSEFEGGHSSFYMMGERIVAAVKIELKGKKEAIVTGPTIMDHNPDLRAYPALLADTIRNVSKKMDEDVMMSLVIADHRLYDVITGILGQPEEDNILHRYIRVV